MCAITEKWYNDGKAEGRAAGKAEGIVEGIAEGRGSVAVKMIKEHLPVELIQKMTEMPLSSLEKLSKECGVALVM